MTHATAVIAPGASLGERVEIGPYAVVDANVVLGDDCRVGPHAYLTGHTRIGAGTAIHAGAVIGGEPQDVRYTGEVSYTEIGRNCVLREYVTVNRGATPGSTTVLGDHCMLMAFAHVGHNSVLGHHVIVANACLLAGHVHVSDLAIISGAVGIHQFVRIGTLAMIGGMNRVVQDVPPYCLLQEQAVQGPNTVGLRRAGIDAAARLAIRTAIKLYFFSGLNRPNALARIREQCRGTVEVARFVEFIEKTHRGIVCGRGEKPAEQGEEARAEE